MRVMLATGFYPGEKMGGAEYQTSLIAQGLSYLGHDVAFLATNAGEEGAFKKDGIDVVEIPGWRKQGWRRYKRLVARALEEHAPDVCYVRTFQELGAIAPICRRLRVPIVSISSHMMETSPFLIGYSPMETIGNLRTIRSFLHLRSFMSIRHSRVHVCILKALEHSIKRWIRDIPIRTIYIGSPVPALESGQNGSSKQVVWVNNMKRWKRPEVFIQLSHRFPQYDFVMIGSMPQSGMYSRTLRTRIRHAPHNYHYHGPMRVEQVNSVISESALLLYTSLPVEGFGNSFLQAWFRGVPTLSLNFDPDGILEREKVGRCSRGFEELAADLEELMADEETRRDMGRRARDYAIHHHSADKMVAEYEALFKVAVNSS